MCVYNYVFINLTLFKLTKRILSKWQKDIYPIVKEIIAQYLGIDPERVVPEAEFIKDLDADSLDVVELVYGY